MAGINLEALSRGDIDALAHAITRAENQELSETDAAQLMERSQLLPFSARYRIGITGSPGVGKSSLTSLLISHFREEELKVAVLAVDPSSVLTGGALLGDRVRMHEHYLDPHVFIRSMSARGHLGGIAYATPLASALMTLAGYSPVIIETVGVGQSEVEVMNHVDTTVLVLAPGAGDDIQSAKAGVMEIADIYLINKVDRDKQGAEKLAQEIIRSLELSPRPDGWKPKVLLVSALDRTGLSELGDALAAHQEFLATRAR